MGVVHNPRFVHPRSIMFDGVGYIRNNSDHRLDLANTWSVMVSARLLAAAGNSVLFQTNQTSGANRISISWSPNSTLLVETRSSANVTIKQYSYALSGTLLFTNRWYHIVFTWDGTTLQLYLNGVATAPTTLSTDSSGTMTDTTTRRTSIGADTAAGNPTIANIAQVATWNSTLSAAEVTSIFGDGSISSMDLRAPIGSYVSSANLRHWWLCGASGIVKDIGYSTFGTVDLTADLSGITEAANCIGDSPIESSYGRLDEYCLDMDGSTERLRTTTARVIGIANAWSVLVFSKSGRDTTQETLFEIRSGVTSTDRIRFQKRGDLANFPLEIECYNSGSTIIKDYSYNNALTVGAWVGICATWDGTTLSVYRNGLPISPDTITSDNAGSMSTTTRAVGFAVGSQADQNYQGRVHSAAVWSTALTPDQASLVSNPYTARWLNLGKGGLGYTSQASLVQWFRMGIGSGDGTTTGAGYTSNDVPGGSTIISGGLSQGAVNITLAGDIFRDSPT